MMRWSYLLLILLAISDATAQSEVIESRISEHAVNTAVALTGLLTLSIFVRRARRRSLMKRNTAN